MLIQSAVDDELRIEGLDDIQIDHSNQTTDLYQMKYHVEKGSLGNASKDIWKALRVWSTELANKQINTRNVKLNLITINQAPKKSAASLLCPKESGIRNEHAALALLRKVAEDGRNKENKPSYDAFLALEDSQQLRLLQCVRVLDSSLSLVDVKDNILMALRPASLEHVNRIYETVEGWWIGRVTDHLKAKSSFAIKYMELENLLGDMRAQYGRKSLPIYAVAGSPSAISKESNFVWQIKLLQLGEDRIIDAMFNHHKAFRHRTQWVKDLSLSDEISRYDDKLTSEWRQYFNSMKEEIVDQTNEHQKVGKGKELYDWFHLKASIPIRPDFLESFIMRGSYHILADRLKVGWHQDFQERIGSRLSIDVEGM